MKRVPACSSPSFNFRKKLHISLSPSSSLDSSPQKTQLEVMKEISILLQSPSDTDTLIIPNLAALCYIIKSKIFRPLPSGVLQNQLEFQDLGVTYENQVDANWPILQQFYEAFFDLARNQQIEARQMKRLINPRFLAQYFYLFDSQEYEERILLRNILHKLYAKIVVRRKAIRRYFTLSYLQAIYEKPYFNGMSQILDINSAIIAGFALPLREQHVQFFHTIMIPMLKIQTLNNFFDECMRCIMLFLSKFKGLAIPLLRGMLRYWAHGNSIKEVRFIILLSDVLEITDLSTNIELLKKISIKIGQCINSNHVQIVDRILCFFENDIILNSMKPDAHLWFAELVPCLRKTATTSWLKIFRESAQSALKILKELSPEEFQKVQPSSVEEDQILEVSAQKWKMIQEKIKEENEGFVPNEVPFGANQIIGGYNELYQSVAQKIIN